MKRDHPATADQPQAESSISQCALPWIPAPC